MINDVRDALRVAKWFVIWDSNGPSGDIGTFRPIEVSYDDKENVWTVKCEFAVKGVVQKALIKIDSISEHVKSYKRVE